MSPKGEWYSAPPIMPAKNALLKGPYIGAAIIRRAKRTPHLMMCRRHPNSRRGDPEIYGCYHGYHIEIAVIQPDATLTDLERDRLEQWKLSGAITGVAHSADEFFDLLYLGWVDRQQMRYRIEKAQLKPPPASS